MSRRMRSSSRLLRSSSRRFASASSLCLRICCFFASSSRSCSNRMRSCSSLRRSMYTLRARASLCSWSTAAITSALTPALGACARGLISATAWLSRLLSTVMCCFTLSLSSTRLPKVRQPLQWSMRAARKPQRTASITIFSTSTGVLNVTSLRTVSSLMVEYTLDTCCKKRSTTTRSRLATYSDHSTSVTGHDAESVDGSAFTLSMSESALWQKSSGWNCVSRSW
mmetsp:Transcript_3139/g.10988  ORF Transcript_3139/g.10988 Transcript_3139/m.10988 type:complete len:225 (+) Transcript_3139:985-1659(+)